MFEITKRKVPKSLCQMCNGAIEAGMRVFVYRFSGYRSKRNIYIHAEHFKFHEETQCPKRYKKLIQDEQCNLCEVKL